MHLLLAEVHGDVDAIFLRQVLRQLGHDEVGTLAAGELLEGVEQIERILPGQVRDVRTLAVARFPVAVGAEHRPFLACGIGVLAVFGVGHDLGEALGQPVIGKGEGSETAEQGNGKDAHGSSLASFHRRDYRNDHRVGYWLRSTKARAADRREPRM